jgi:hypothetical protein
VETTVVVEREDAVAVAVVFKALLFCDILTRLMLRLQQLVLHRLH